VHILFLDETGFHLQPLVARTWAPRGTCPQLEHSVRYGHISCVAAVAVSPIRYRPRLFATFHSESIKEKELLQFLRDLLKSHPCGFIVIMDRAPTHRCRQVRDFLSKSKRVILEYLPPYCPELNPTEGAWRQVKTHELPNYCLSDLDELLSELTSVFERVCRRPSLLLSFFKKSGLRL
jgi:transposase